MNKWDLSYFFANDEEFEKALEGLNDYLPKLSSYKGQLSDEAKLKEYLLLSDELETKLYKVYQYAHLKSDLNKKNVENASKMSKVTMFLALLGQTTSFESPEILSLGKKKVTATPLPTKAPTINDVQIILSKELIELGEEYIVCEGSKKVAKIQVIEVKRVPD